jgi:hypothetical protein
LNGNPAGNQERTWNPLRSGNDCVLSRRQRQFVTERPCLTAKPRAQFPTRKKSMTLKVVGVILALLAVPAVAQAQGVPGGAAHGFQEGNRIAGPVGAVVGTAVGGVIGGVEGVLGVNQRPVAHTDYSEAPPPAYRRHRASRHKAHSSRRGRHHRAGYVSR